MIYYIPYHPNHAAMINFVEEESSQNYMPPGIRREWMVPGLSYSAIKDGKVVACFGLLPLFGERALAWAMFDKDIGKSFVSVSKRARFMMEEQLRYNFSRIEAYVDTSYPQAKRLVELWGFELEGIMKKFDNEKDYFLYARVK
jgi:hypothetical protein